MDYRVLTVDREFGSGGGRIAKEIADRLGWKLALKDENRFDPDVITELTKQIIQSAYADGDCVLGGRGPQCILQAKMDAFHAFVYAPHRTKVQASVTPRIGR